MLLLLPMTCHLAASRASSVLCRPRTPSLLFILVQVMRRVESAVAASNLEDVFKYCPLLGPLGLAAEGAKIYERFAQRLLHESLAQFSEVPDKGGKDPRAGSAVVLLPRIFNTVAAFLQHHLPLVRSLRLPKPLA